MGSSTALKPTIDGLAAALLFDAFDAVCVLPADLVLFERDCAIAPGALRHWAATRNRSVVEREILPGCFILSVATLAERHIDVHLKPF